MTILAVIPARYASTRFPGKPLVDVQGKPMIQRVYENVIKSDLFTEVVVATDDERIVKVAESFAKNHANTFSIEMWGGATFDVCLRFLYESPWSRLRDLRKAMPNILFQMLLRGSNAVGYKAYPDNLIERFVDKSWENGIDIFRIFDSLNWVKAMEPSIKYVRNTNGALAEAAISYTGNILDTTQTKYKLNYYTQLAKDLENAGAHIIALKDMAGLLTPYAATELIGALRDVVKLPIHLHTHDTSSLQSATYLKAIEAMLML